MGPDAGEIFVMVGVTVNKTRLLPILLTITMTLPVVAPEGTGTTIVVLLQLVGVAVDAPKVTALAPCVVPKLFPVMVTEVPVGPDVGERLVMLGATLKGAPLLAKPLTVTTTFPVVAELGTAVTMLVLLQLVGVAVAPLKVTVLVPWEGPKFVPVMVTEAPKKPKVGLRLVMLGGTITVNAKGLLATPPTVTTTFPLFAPLGTVATMLVLFQLVAVAATPLNETVLVPCEAPKFAPAMVTVAPTCPDDGLRLAMLGAVPPVPGAALKAAKIPWPLMVAFG